jgi:hypothetical protein
MGRKWRFDVLWRALRNRRILSSEQQETPVREIITDEGYYREISLRYGTAQVIGIMLLAVFVAVSLVTNTELLSANNLIYFAKDLTSSIAMRESEARDTLVYASDADNQFVLYRDGLAALGKDKLTVFTATGREAHSHLLSYETPRLVTSGRYLLSYNLGATEFSLYNSFTNVKTATTAQNIRNAAICNKGYYCLVTDGQESESRVELYNDSHRMISRYSLQEYTICAAIRDDAEELAVVSVSTKDGRMVTHIALVTPGASEWGTTWTVADAYPVQCHYTDEGNLMLLTSNALYWFDASGQMLNSHAFSPSDVYSFRADGEGCVLMSRANAYNNDTRVEAFDKEGNRVYNITVTGAVLDAARCEMGLAVLTRGELTVYRTDFASDRVSVTLKEGYRVLLPCENNEFMLCGDAKAITVQPK